jgi:DNA-binding NarL/FixJ family response regulator
MVAGRACGGVLIADDDLGVLELLGVHFGGSGYTVLGATSGRRALEIAAEEPLAAAVLDVNLPGVSGYEVCHRLRGRFGRVLPIVFVSGERTEPYDRIGGLLLGADDYVVKPFDPGEVLARVQSLLERAATAAPTSRLTPRELEVLGLLAEGFDQGAIATRLVLSSKTVATHIERILVKLGVHSRAQAVAIAYRQSLVAT